LNVKEKIVESSCQKPDISLKCNTCGSDKIKNRMIWSNPENGQIYPKTNLLELIILLVLMGLSLFWFIATVIYHQNPLLMVLSVVLFTSLTTVCVIEGLRFLGRKKYEETCLYTCQSCGSQWMASDAQGSSSQD